MELVRDQAREELEHCSVRNIGTCVGTIQPLEDQSRLFSILTTSIASGISWGGVPPSHLINNSECPTFLLEPELVGVNSGTTRSSVEFRDQEGKRAKEKGEEERPKSPSGDIHI